MKIKILLAIAVALGVCLLMKPAESKQEVIVQKDLRAEYIDSYFASRQMPLVGYGEVFVKVADQYGLDYRLLPAIAVREQSGGKVLPYNCPNRTKNYNAFGWGSGKNCFHSFNEAIQTVGMKLGTLPYYKGKSTLGKLQTYNPPSVVKNYAYEVMAIMDNIAPENE